MKYTFYLKAAKNGGVIVVVRGNSTPINPLVEAAEAMANKMNKDPMLLAAEAMAKENNELQEAYEKADLTGDYYFNWYTPDGIKKNPTDQAFEFIRYLIEEFGLGCDYGYTLA